MTEPSAVVYARAVITEPTAVAEAPPVSPLQRRKNELGTFLRQRRATLRPEDLGLAAIGRRHVKGLRREELASAAGISTSWYTLLEQGRADVVTTRTLVNIADALRLSTFEREHLVALARTSHAATDAELRPPPKALIDFVKSYSLAPTHMHDARFDFVAWNPLTNGYLYVDEHGARPNLLRIMVDDPRVRDSFVDPDWKAVLRIMVGHFKLFYARYGGPDFDELAEELASKCETFRRCWDEPALVNMPAKPNVMQHRDYGRAVFDVFGFTAHEAPSYFVVMHALISAERSPK